MSLGLVVEQIQESYDGDHKKYWASEKALEPYLKGCLKRMGVRTGLILFVDVNIREIIQGR